jgi:hypothetical protein
VDVEEEERVETALVIVVRRDVRSRDLSVWWPGVVGVGVWLVTSGCAGACGGPRAGMSRPGGPRTGRV